MNLRKPTNGLVKQVRKDNEVHIPEGLDIDKVYQTLIEFEERILQAYEGQIDGRELSKDILLRLQEKGLSATPFGLIYNLAYRIKKISREQKSY